MFNRLTKKKKNISEMNIKINIPQLKYYTRLWKSDLEKLLRITAKKKFTRKTLLIVA